MGFLDVRVLNPTPKWYANLELLWLTLNKTKQNNKKKELSKAYEINKKRKKKAYNKRILQVENGSFTPLVIWATGAMRHECLFKLSRNDLKEKENQLQCYNHIDPWKNCISLRKPIGICILGSRSVFQNGNLEMSLSGDGYASEFQSNLQINKITHDTRHRFIFVMIIDKL